MREQVSHRLLEFVETLRVHLSDQTPHSPTAPFRKQIRPSAPLKAPVRVASLPRSPLPPSVPSLPPKPPAAKSLPPQPVRKTQPKPPPPPPPPQQIEKAPPPKSQSARSVESSQLDIENLRERHEKAFKKVPALAFSEEPPINAFLGRSPEHALFALLIVSYSDKESALLLAENIALALSQTHGPTRLIFREALECQQAAITAGLEGQSPLLLFFSPDPLPPCFDAFPKLSLCPLEEMLEKPEAKQEFWKALCQRDPVRQ